MDRLQLVLTDAFGKIVYHNYLPSGKSGQQINIPLSHLSKGVYLLKIQSDKVTRTDKILVN
jgi:hypothetical protein